MSGLMFADDFVGVSETPEDLQKQVEKALEYTRKWRVTSDVKKCAVVVLYRRKGEPGKFPLEVDRRLIASIRTLASRSQKNALGIHIQGTKVQQKQ